MPWRVRPCTPSVRAAIPPGMSIPGRWPCCSERVFLLKGSAASPGMTSPSPHVVITVCASAAGETCPAYLGPAIRAHWGVEDPAKATGSEAEIEAAFDTAYRILRHRIEAMCQLPVAELMEKGPAQLRAELSRIGSLEP